jgi:hypothetical protein
MSLEAVFNRLAAGTAFGAGFSTVAGKSRVSLV